MLSPTQGFEKIWKGIKTEWKLAFLSTFIVGLLVHMPIMLSDIPNHDGLGSLYFDQNMVTSGRFFLTVACGFSSYYTIPWLIGLLGLVFLGIAASVIVEVLEVRQTWAVVLAGGLLAAFPALASTFAYVFTLDGYMLALLLAVLAVLLTKKYSWGFLPGALCLALSMGTYQAYLPFAMLLSLFAIFMLWTSTRKKKVATTLRYVYMGGLGVGLYYLILFVCLKLQGKELAAYQGINAVGSGQSENLWNTLVKIYRDFFAFTLDGKVLWQNVFTLIAMILLVLAVVVTIALKLKSGSWGKIWTTVLIVALAMVVLPLFTNAILLVSPSVTYHLLMRYQWVLYLIGAVALLSHLGSDEKIAVILQWAGCLAVAVLVFSYAVTNNIAYGNLEKKYEKTYAYCQRLLDRIEQTDGYYQGIPIAMIGVVGDEQYPVTDLTFDVTSNMIGMSGDMLLYTGENYKAFMASYLGATLNVLPAEAMSEMYYSEEYISMDTFPGEDSIRVIDGVMYIKTENTAR